jgi:hypothetical protein
VYYNEGTRYDITGEDISKELTMAATLLQYPTTRSIRIDRINTHSLRIGGANALALSGYSDTQIQKMGRWKGATFKEYIREELTFTLQACPSNMKRSFKFFNISGSAAYIDITATCLESEYNTSASAGAA